MARLSRRRLLTGASMVGAAGLVAARSNAALAKAPALRTQAPAFYRFKVGSIEGTVVSDGPIALGDSTKIFLGDPDEVRRLMTEHFLPTASSSTRTRSSSIPATSSSCSKPAWNR
jgi:hypothetical protein